MKLTNCTVGFHMKCCHEAALDPRRKNSGMLAPSNGDDARSTVMAGKVCLECGNATVIHTDGCEFCTARGDVGQCG